jgi:hypothetical protein
VTDWQGSGATTGERVEDRHAALRASLRVFEPRRSVRLPGRYPSVATLPPWMLAWSELGGSIVSNRPPTVYDVRQRELPESCQGQKNRSIVLNRTSHHPATEERV